MMNILFTCVGRRVELIQSFRQAASKNKIELTIFGTDITRTAPALYFCDSSFISCKITDDNYIPFLLKVCKEKKIDLLIPTIDTDLLVLAEHKDEFKNIGTLVLISCLTTIQICRNKDLTSKFLLSIGLNTPILVKDICCYSGGYPAFIRPVNGSSSIDAYKVNNEKDLRVYAEKIKEYIVAKYVEGTEFTVDVFCDFNCEPIFVTPRIRIATRSGEVSKTQIKYDESINEDIKLLLKHLKIVGPAAIQIIKSNRDNMNYFIEVNPRFGGGSPISMMAGANSAEALLLLMEGHHISFSPNAAKNLSVYSRYDQTVEVENDDD